jgi:hypothetical protein
MACIVCNKPAEGAHVVAKHEFSEYLMEIHGRLGNMGEEDVQNIVNLCPNHHRIQMDQLVGGNTVATRHREIVYDFLNQRCMIKDVISGEIGPDWRDWTYNPDVKREYFAYSNSLAIRKLKKKIMRVDSRLTKPEEWLP